ncbi:microtubule organization protein AKNA isoform X2 [Xenopus laevis]|uniref:Microtubule organization protein AKNA isoform X2 n=1 Tax=Xenopus laevis TaxID=8355 RepID=A0A8J1LIC3_XENLA|nr:microtubule organization protein AKNA isoform X2 [Xenopus laevis]
MNINSSHEEHEISGDEKGNFAEHMDENGIIGLDDQGDLGPEEERILEFDQELILGLEEHLVSYPEASSDEELSGTQSLGQFSFSQIADETSGILQDNNEALTSSNSITDMLDTDGHDLEDHPDASLSLPPPTNWRPPSRDQQLDMTEDEQDGGTSLGRSDEDDESWGHEHSDLPYNNSPSPERFKDYNQTLMEEEQWDNPSISSWNHANPKISAHERIDIPSILSVSPSPHPMSNHWGNEILSDLGGLNIASRIEDETLPESSCTDSGEPSIAASSGNRQRAGINHTKVLYQSNHSPSLGGKHRSSIKLAKSSAVPIYGRGQLNYPLPDFSKVGPRVRFPKDESYRPPQSKRLDSKPQKSPSIFKSPAEIVREVLMSSSENPTQEHATQRTVPTEFQSPQQATELVHQLQEDYHKLLTKYAEAENTIDRLRLGAKVNLYSDPPKPSHSVHMGTVLQGSKVMEFTIPQAQRGTFSSTNDGDGVTEWGTGPQIPDHHTEIPTDIPQAAPSPSSSPLHPSEEMASTLSSHIFELNQEVGLLEELRRSGKLNLEEQQQALLELQGSLDVLQRRYLRAREEHRSGQPHGSTFQELDPERVLEGAIFQLGFQLDELQENVGDQIAAQAEAEHKAESLSPLPMPSSVAPIPAVITPYPEIPQSEDPVGLLSSGLDAVNKVEAGEELPQPLRHKQIEVEKEYDTLISTYNSFKTLPDALGLDQDEWPKTHHEDFLTQDTPLDTQYQDQPHEASSHIFSSDARPSHKLQDIQLRKLSLETTGQDLEYESVPHNQRPLSRHKDHQWFTGPHDYHTDKSLKSQRRPSSHKIQLQPSGLEKHMHPTRPQSNVNIEKTSDIGTPRQSQPHIEPRRLSHDQVSQKPSPEGGRQSSSKRVLQSPKVVPRTSPALSRLSEESPRSSTHQPSIDGENAQSARSNRSSISSKSVSSSIKGEKTQHKNNSVQGRIISPETDSGFLGSESASSPLLQRKRNEMNHQGMVAAELPTSSNSSPGRSKMGALSRARKTFFEKKQQNGHGTRPSQPSSPSLGSNSLTEIENQEQSPISESDSEKVGSHAMISDPYFGGPFLLSPITKHSQPHGNFLETRTARDQAIQDLQKEVVELRKHLENSLNRTPSRGKANEAQRPVTSINLQEDRVDHFEPARVAPKFERSKANSPQRRPNPVKSETTLRPALTEKVARRAYTGTSYSRSEERCIHCREQVPTQPREHIPNVRRSTPVPSVHSDEGDTSFSEHLSCPLCCRDSPATQRNGVIKNPTTKRGRRSQMGPHGGQWVFNETPPLSYMQTPFISYNPSVIPSPYLMIPAGYSMAELHSPCAVTPLPVPASLQLEDLSLPLNRALEAAKELKITSKRMCHSLTTDLSLQHTLRRSCLF